MWYGQTQKWERLFPAQVSENGTCVHFMSGLQLNHVHDGSAQSWETQKQISIDVEYVSCWWLLSLRSMNPCSGFSYLFPIVSSRYFSAKHSKDYHRTLRQKRGEELCDTQVCRQNVKTRKPFLRKTTKTMKAPKPQKLREPNKRCGFTMVCTFFCSKTVSSKNDFLIFSAASFWPGRAFYVLEKPDNGFNLVGQK